MRWAITCGISSTHEIDVGRRFGIKLQSCQIEIQFGGLDLGVESKSVADAEVSSKYPKRSL